MAGFTLGSGGGGQNYTGILTRSIVFSATMIAFLGATAMTLAANIIPDWISFNSTLDSGNKLRYTYGLHKRCSSTTGTCVPFPQAEDCLDSERYFCSMWRTVGFLMSLAVVLEGMTVVAFLVLLSGGKQKREAGWGVLSTLVVVAAVVQAGSMSLIAYLYDFDPRFFPGWKLDESWYLCTVSWAIQIICGAAITAAAIMLPSEGGYELIPDPVFNRQL